MSEIKREVEKYWAAWLNSAALDLSFYASKADAENDPPFGVVRVKGVEEILPNSGVYRIEEVQILVINSIDSANSAEQATLAGNVSNAISQSPQHIVTEELEVCGFAGLEVMHGTDEDSERYADIFSFAMGARLRNRAQVAFDYGAFPDDPAGPFVKPSRVSLGAYTAAAIIAGGRFIHFNGSGQLLAADSSNDRPAQGYIIAAVASGETIEVFAGGVITTLSGLTAGEGYFLGTSGQVTGTAPASGFVQPVGAAISASILAVDIEEPVYLD